MMIKENTRVVIKHLVFIKNSQITPVLAYVVKERPASIVKNDKDVVQPFVTSFYWSWRKKAFRPLLVGWLLDFAGIC